MRRASPQLSAATVATGIRLSLCAPLNCRAGVQTRTSTARGLETLAVSGPRRRHRRRPALSRTTRTVRPRLQRRALLPPRVGFREITAIGRTARDTRRLGSSTLCLPRPGLRCPDEQVNHDNRHGLAKPVLRALWRDGELRAGGLSATWALSFEGERRHRRRGSGAPWLHGRGGAAAAAAAGEAHMQGSVQRWHAAQHCQGKDGGTLSGTRIACGA